MALSLDSSSPSPAQLHKEPTISMDTSPLFSPSSEKRFWSALHNRVDALLDNRKCPIPIRASDAPAVSGESDRGKRLRDDSLLLLRGFDSISASLSQLTSNLDTALQGARDLARPSLTEIFHSNLKREEREEEEKEPEERIKKAKRKLESDECSEDQVDLVKRENDQSPKSATLKKAKNLAVSMASKAASFARELKSIKSDLFFMQERCALLEEENRRLRDGVGKDMRAEEDDLVRLQLEALLAEKSRLANENANLLRENQCLHQLVEYHQATSQDLSASYEQVIRGMCLDFSSPPPTIAEEGDDRDGVDGDVKGHQTPGTHLFGFSTSLDECFSEEQHQQ